MKRKLTFNSKNITKSAILISARLVSAGIKAILARIMKIRVYRKIKCRPGPGPGEFRKKFAGPGPVRVSGLPG